MGSLASAVLSPRQSTACRFLSVAAVAVMIVVMVVGPQHDRLSRRATLSSLSVYLLQDKARQNMGEVVARHGHEHGQGYQQRSST